MLSNTIIKKRLLGGAGTSSGAKKGWKTRRSKESQKCIKTKNLKVYADNINLPSSTYIPPALEQIPPPPPPQDVMDYQIPRPPIKLPKKLGNPTLQNASPLEKSIDTKVNRMSIAEVIKMNKELNKGKKAPPKLDFLNELKQQVSKPKLKKATERKIKEKPKQELSLHEQLMQDLKARQIKGSGLYDGSGYRIPQNQEYLYRHPEFNKRYLDLIRKRNLYAY